MDKDETKIHSDDPSANGIKGQLPYVSSVSEGISPISPDLKVFCDVCNSFFDVYGYQKRFKCMNCQNFDLCASCEEKSLTIHDPTHIFAELNIPITQLLKTYPVFTDCEALSNKMSHYGVICDGCEMVIQNAVRYHCINCFDIDLCESCKSKGDKHDRTHIFLKAKVPLLPREKCPYIPPSSLKIRRPQYHQKTSPPFFHQFQNFNDRKTDLEKGSNNYSGNQHGNLNLNEIKFNNRKIRDFNFKTKRDFNKLMEIEKLCFDEPFDESFLLYLLSKKNCFCKIIEVSMENISKDLNNEGTLQKEIMNNELYRSILFPHNNANISVNNNNNMVVTDVIEGTYLAGYVIYELVDKKNCQIVSISILPEYRGQRLAEELLRYVINVAHKEYISLHCLTSNLSAQKLYSRLGFKTISWDVNYYHSMNADGILMRLHVDPHTGTHTDN